MTTAFRHLGLALLLMLGSCNNEPGSADSGAGALEAPRSVRVDASRCATPSAGGLLAHEWVNTPVEAGETPGLRHCVRAFTGMRSALAVRESAQAVPSRLVTATELFNWAERQYPQFFPSSRVNLQLGAYTYRYYPETQNHAALAGNEIFVQGPISGGSLLRVGTLEEYSCLVDATLCSAAPRDCAAPTSWLVDGSICVPDALESTTIASGSTIGYIDSTGTTTGAASFRCVDGVRALVGTPTCQLAPPRACDTSALSWTVSAQTCNANSTDPKTMNSGTSFQFTDSSGTSGNATYQCNDGALSLVGQPSCNPPVQSCNAIPREWKVGEDSCVADAAPSALGSGASATLADTVDPVIGAITYLCSNGTLLISGAPTCVVNQPRMEDSFGGDGGAADGGASGDGTAGDGAPIVGGTVWAVDTTGRTVFAAATTDSQGYFRLKLTGMVPPLVLNVRRPDGVIRRSLSTQPLKTNGYIFIAVTGLTDFVAADVARQVSGVNSSAALTPAMIAAQPGAVPAAVNAMRNNPFVNAELIAAGINPNTFDPLATPFRPNGTGHDAVLDNLVITVDATGATQIGPTYCFTPKSWTVGNNTCVPNEGTPATIASFRTLIVTDSVGALRGTVGFTCVRGVLQAPVLPTCQAN